MEEDDIATALCKLAANGKEEKLSCWIDAKVKLDSKDYHGRTPLMVACACGQFRYCKVTIGCWRKCQKCP